MKMNWYVGLAVTTYALIAFRASATPTEASGYLAVIGPFRTKRAALWAEKYGSNNPHFQHVNDAERLSKVGWRDKAHAESLQGEVARRFE